MNEIAVVTEQDIPDILRMIHEIYSELPNKEWFSLPSHIAFNPKPPVII